MAPYAAVVAVLAEGVVRPVDEAVVLLVPDDRRAGVGGGVDARPLDGGRGNVVEWVLTSPEARAQLIEWRESWALSSIAALRVNAEKWLHDERLQEIIEKVRLDPTARRMWNDADLPTVTYP
ncbi:hypothetical protein PV682_43470, partial [Streptomyces niveiscabiei]|nr:hypothetical protein [Streptomyces niveiscabiei]